MLVSVVGRVLVIRVVVRRIVRPVAVRRVIVRAVGPVEVLRLSRDDTRRLSETFDAFGKGVTMRA